MNEKYPGGVEAQRELLEREGHKVVQKGKKYIVVDFEKCLVEWNSVECGTFSPILRFAT